MVDIKATLPKKNFDIHVKDLEEDVNLSSTKTRDLQRIMLVPMLRSEKAKLKIKKFVVVLKCWNLQNEKMTKKFAKKLGTARIR